MSFTENDRIFRSKSGKTFPNEAAAGASPRLATAIAAALSRDFGSSPGAVKRVAKLVNANERAVRNWFDAKNGPSGEHLVKLMRHSPSVVEVVLALSDQSGLVQAKLVADAKHRVRQLLAMLDDLTETEAADRSP
jgi:hypothetical protein